MLMEQVLYHVTSDAAVVAGAGGGASSDDADDRTTPDQVSLSAARLVRNFFLWRGLRIYTLRLRRRRRRGEWYGER